MIVALVGPVADDTTAVAELLAENNNSKIVDIVQVLRDLNGIDDRAAARKIINGYPVSADFQKVYLKSLEQAYGSVIVQGNIGLTSDTLKWLLEQNSTVGVVNRNSMDEYDEDMIESTKNYYADIAMQEYELVERFINLKNELKHPDKVFQINLGGDETELEDAVESMTNIIGTPEVKNTDTNAMDILLGIGGDTTMKIEDTIKKAMAELGMDVEAPAEESKPAPKPKQEKKSEPKKVVKEPEPEVDDKESNTEEVNALYCKISGNKMALLIPEGMKLEQQTIGDMVFNVITVDVPDLKNTKLQELTQAVAPQPKKVEKPIMNPPVDEKPVEKKKPELVPMPVNPKGYDEHKKRLKEDFNIDVDLDDLKSEKARLDDAIKQARAAGDQELVDSLRKQRRAVRKKINAAKEQ